MTVTRRWGSEFLVNTTVLNDQSASSVTALSDGRFVVSWSDLSQTGGDASGLAIRAQIFNANGTLAGLEFRVNTATLNDQSQSSITALEGGRFVVCWNDGSASGGDLSGSAIRAQVYNADGTVAGGEVLVNSTTPFGQSDSSVTALADGRFVVSWTDQSGTGGDLSGLAIRAQVFNPDGTMAGTELLVNTTTTLGQSQSSITALEGGRFVVSWTDQSGTGGDMTGSAIRAQIFNADGSKAGLELLVNTTTLNNQSASSITALADGRFVISWTDYSATGGDLSGTAVRAQVFNADGTRAGVELLVNTTISSDQFISSIAALADGRFVVSWTDFSQTGSDASSFAIRAQVFNADGTKAGAEVLVNATTPGGQLESSITALADGRFVISWTDGSATGGDLSGTAIRAQIFDPRNEAVTLWGGIGTDDLVGTFLADSLSGGFGDDTLAGGNGADRIAGEAGTDSLYGNAGADWIEGASGNDTLFGGLGDDRLFGGTGNDRLDGGLGGDELHGGTGNDTYVWRGGEVMIEAAGEGTADRVLATQSFVLDPEAEIEILQTNNPAATALIALTGNAFGQTLIGNAGVNSLDGGQGNDTLTGGAGNDAFVFSTAPGAGNIDRITDFQGAGPAPEDLIHLSRAVFAGISATSGILSGSRFLSSVDGLATTATQRILYDNDQGLLYYDADGSGGGARIQIAVLTGAPALTANDIFLF